jgi:hypothetical protein
MRAPAAQLRLLREREPQASRSSRLLGADGRSERVSGSPSFAPIWLVLAGCLALSGLTLFLPSTPTYDPWAWILWGREIFHLDLVTTGGPSWKPLPILFTTPFSIFGDEVAPFLWIWIARAGALLACAMAYRVARRLVGAGWYGVLAGVTGALALFSSYKFIRDGALANSEALLAGLVLWAFERHLDGRRDHALYLGFAGALLRPEVWPFLAAYGLWLWFREPRLRVRMLVMGALIPALWFLPEWWGSGDPFRAGSRANNPNPGSAGLAEHPALELIKRFRNVVIAPAKAGAVIAAAYALYEWFRHRRQGPIAALVFGGAAWFLLVAGMTQAGFAGNQRYLIVTTAAIAVLGGIGAARVLQGVAWLATRMLQRPQAGPAAAAVACVGALGISTPFIFEKVDNTDRVLGGLEHEAEIWHDLKVLLDRNGGRRVLDCGRVASGPFQTQMLAYELHIDGIDILWRTTPAPGVAFRTRTVPDGPLVVKPTDDRFRLIDRYGKWRLLTVPPPGKSSCPHASPDAPTAVPPAADGGPVRPRRDSPLE